MGTANRGSTRPGGVYFTTDLDPAPKPELMESGRTIAESLSRFLRNIYPEFAAATGSFIAGEPGVGETYRWRGRYTLSAADLVDGTEFPDCAAYAT
jgi:hypothetical protein